MLRAHGLPLARTLALPDHHDFENWLPGAYAAYTILCTEKDAVKLWRKEPAALAVPLLVSPEPAFLRELDARLSASLAARPGSTLSSPHGHTTS
jgi:Tetraacyldisaccharide-1-P 4''-kinase